MASSPTFGLSSLKDSLKSFTSNALQSVVPSKPTDPAPTAAPTAAVGNVAETKLPPASFSDRFWRGLPYDDTPEYKELSALPEDQRHQALRQFVSESLPTRVQSLDEARSALPRMFQLLRPDTEHSRQFGDIAKQRMQAYAEQLEPLYDQENYTPQQRQEFMRTALQEGMVPGGSPLKSMAATAVAQAKVDSEIKRVSENFDKVMEATEVTKMNAGDFGNYMLQNWSNLVTPVGVLLALFGGNGMTRILGIMGAAFGAAGLYGRYKVMSDPNHPANGLFTEGVQLATIDTSNPANPKPLEQPFSNLPQVQARLYETALQRTRDPKQAEQLAGQALQGVRDFQIASSVGFGDSIRNRAQETAERMRRVYDFGRAAPQ